MIKNLLKISTILSSLYILPALAQNLGFENGTTSDWTGSTTTAVGSQTIKAGSNTWVINPYGSYMGKIQIQSGTYNQMATALGLTSTSTTNIQNMLTQQAQVHGGNPNTTTAGWVTQQVTLTAGTQFTLAWQYVSVDYVPYNDGSIAILTQNGTNNAIVNNYAQQYALLGFTNPGTGDYSTGSYGATGWQVATFDVTADGTYTLGFGVFNMGDTALSPVLFIDELQGTTTKNGQAFNPVSPNAGTSAPASPGSSGGGAPSPTSAVNTGDTAGTGNLASAVTVSGGTIQVSTTGITLTNTFTVGSNGMTVDQNGKTAQFDGVISGAGGVTIANTGTGGAITFSGINTYTGATAINTGATLINQGSIASSSGVINNGTFTNSGTAPNVVNNGTFTNSGTAGNLTNSATATNTGVLGTVTNNAAGNFTNGTNGITGAVTNAGTLSNAGTMASLNNSGTATNTGTITGAIVNSYIFTNSSTGRTGSLTNTSAGTVNNSGTVGAVQNAGIFNNLLGGITGLFTNSSTGTVTNRGTLAGLTNSGTATNYGTITGAINNNANGTFTNYSNGSFSSITNNGTATNNGNITGGTIVNNGNGIVINNGSIIGSVVTNNATATNNGTMEDLTNTGTFNNSVNSTAGVINNSGTVNNAGTVGEVTNTGTFNNLITGITSLFTNNNIANNSGIMGDVANSGTLAVNDAGNTGDIINITGGVVNFNGTGTVGAITNAGTTNITGTGTAGAIVNTGTVNLTGGATLTNVDNRSWFNILTTRVLINSVTNSSNFNISGAGGDVAVTTHIQTPSGNLIMEGDQKYNIAGTGTLDGTLTINNSPTAFGRYTFITAQSILGTFTALSLNPDISPLGAYLKYSDSDVKLYVTPSSVATQQSIDIVKNDTNNMNRLVSGKIAGALSNDCVDTGELAGCVSFGIGRTKTTSGNLTAGTMTVGFGLVNNMRMGVFLDKSFNNPTIGSVRYNPTIPLMGGYVGWSENGINVVASAAKQKGQYTISRPIIENAEAGIGVENTTGIAYQIKTSYTMPLLKDLSVTPYAGIRQTRMNISAYTETGNVFPLSINQYSQTTTDLLGGLSIGYNITDSLTASISGGVVKNVAYRAGSIDGSSEIQNMFTFSNPLPGKKYLSGSLGAGLIYEFAPGQKIGLNVGWQQRSLLDASVGSFGLTYSLGF